MKFTGLQKALIVTGIAVLIFVIGTTMRLYFNIETVFGNQGKIMQSVGIMMLLPNSIMYIWPKSFSDYRKN